MVLKGRGSMKPQTEPAEAGVAAGRVEQGWVQEVSRWFPLCCLMFLLFIFISFYFSCIGSYHVKTNLLLSDPPNIF